jgi:hypothetical protein
MGLVSASIALAVFSPFMTVHERFFSRAAKVGLPGDALCCDMKEA